MLVKGGKLQQKLKVEAKSTVFHFKTQPQAKSGQLQQLLVSVDLVSGKFSVSNLFSIIQLWLNHVFQICFFERYLVHH